MSNNRMNLSRRLGVLLLAILLLMAAGCKTSTDDQPATEADKTETKATDAPTEEATEAADPNKISFPYTGEEITFTYLFADVGQGAEVTDEMVVAKAIQDAIGNISLDMELLPWDDYDTKAALYLSSGEIPDIMIAREPKGKIEDYAETGVFLDWAPLMEAYMPNVTAMSSDYAVFDIFTNDSGNLYGIPGTFYDEDWCMEGWYYNKTVLDQYGVAVPTTKDELLEAMRTLKAANPDIIPFQNAWGMDYMKDGAMAKMYDSTDTGVQYNADTKKWEFGPTKEGSQFKSYLQFLNTLWTEGLVNPELNTASDEQMLALIDEGNWGFSYYYLCYELRDLSVEIDTMLCPKGDNGTAYVGVSAAMDGIPYWGIVGSAKNEHPEILAQLADFMFSDEITVLRNWGVEGVTYEVNADGSMSYLPSIKTGANPAGTIETGDIGFGKNPIGALFGIQSVEAMKTKDYAPKDIASMDDLVDALDNGILLPDYPVSTPEMTPEELETVSTILAPIETYIDESIYKFIMGSMSFDDWDEFIANIESYGDIQTVLDIYNSKEMNVLNGNWR